jgi:hypothetical protein
MMSERRIGVAQAGVARAVSVAALRHPHGR